MKSDNSETTTEKPGSNPDLSATFAPPSPGAWRAEVDALLKGVPFEKALVTPLLEGFSLQPIFRREDIANLPHLDSLPGLGDRVRGRTLTGTIGTPWKISQELPYGLPESFNAVARHDLAQGQTELNIPLDLATRAGQDPDVAEVGKVGACGLSLATLSDMERAFDGIDLANVPLYFRAGSSGLPIAVLLFALARKKGVPTQSLRGCIEMDPYASLAWKGTISLSLETAFREIAALTRYAATHAPQLQTIGVQSHPYHNGGASAVQELGFAIATAVDYMRRLQQFGLAIDTVAPRIRFAFSIGSEFFVEIAKYRAARLLWSRVISAFGGNDASAAMYIHARTGLRNKASLDPASNFLRATSEAFSAVVGGCNGLHIAPFDEVVRVPDAFSRRIARNSHIILRDECGLDRVIDPAGGSYAVEWLTDRLARDAWTLFQELESVGGMGEALKLGIPQKHVAAIAQARATQLARRKDLSVGVNAYPNASETPLDPKLPDYKAIHQTRSRQVASYRISAGTYQNTVVMEKLASLLEASENDFVEHAIEAMTVGASVGEICRTARTEREPPPAIPAIPQERLARPYEALRRASWDYAREKGHPPRILQANYGPSRAYRMRADWTAAFFQAGGFEVLADRDFQDAEDIRAAVESSGSHVVVIVAPDEHYPEIVPLIAGTIKNSNPDVYVIVAGAPGDRESEFRNAGIDDFVHVRVNHYEMNLRLLQRLGVIAS